MYKDINKTSWSFKIANYLDNCNPAKRSLTKKFLKHIKDIDVPLGNLNLENIRDFLAQNNNPELMKSAIKRFIRAMQSEGFKFQFNTDDIKTIKNLPVKLIDKNLEYNKAFTKEELDLILSKIIDITMNRDRLIFNILFDTKIGIDEILNLKFKNFDNGILSHNGKKYILTKTTWDLFNTNICANPDYENVLFRSFEGKPLSRVAFLTRIRSIKESLGIKGSLVIKLNKYCQQ